MYDFDEVIERRSSGALKWVRYSKEVLPLWVADSDFKCAPAILEGLSNSVEHGILGYHPADSQATKTAVIDWLLRRHNWQIKAEWIVWTPGVVTAFNGICSTFCQKGDKVLVQKPNYTPLLAAPENNHLIIETIDTHLENGRWSLDFDELERKAKHPKTKLLLLCNPMNPCGSVLTKQELQQIESICLANNVLICSDEIHCDLILDEEIKHIPAGTLPKIGEQTITLMAASKTFNVAGLSTAFAIIPDSNIRAKYLGTIATQMWVNALGLRATELAFTQCDAWYEQQLVYLRSNRDYLASAFSELPGFNYIPAAATYLAWVDASALAVQDVQKYFLSKGVAPSSGQDFGWPSFSRINFACPRIHLEQAIEKLRSDE